MRSLFDSLRKINIIREILRYSIGFLFIILGIILGYFIKPYWIIIGIFLCMLQSIIILSTMVRKNKKWDMLINNTFNEYIPGLINDKSSESLDYAYRLFDIENITNSIEILLNHKFKSNGINVLCATIKCRFNGNLSSGFMRLYVFESGKMIDLNEINSKNLNGFRYEYKDGNVFLISVVDKEYSLYPKYYSTYDGWVMSIKDEMIFIDSLTKKMEEL